MATAVLLLGAAAKTGNGEVTDDSWPTRANWDSTGGGGTAPGANDSLLFAGNTRLDPVNNFAAGTVFQNRARNGGTHAVTLAGSLSANPATLLRHGEIHQKGSWKSQPCG